MSASEHAIPCFGIEKACSSLLTTLDIYAALFFVSVVADVKHVAVDMNRMHDFCERPVGATPGHVQRAGLQTQVSMNLVKT